MQKKDKFFLTGTISVLLSTFLSFLLIGCKEHNNEKTALKVGVIAGPESEIMQAAKMAAKKQFGLNIQIIEFNDYILPNTALADGSIDANVFQHEPYLSEQIKNKHYHLAVVGKTFIYPMGLYSAKIKNLAAFPISATIAIPNDPSNEGRALLLLQQAKLIKLASDAGLYALPKDIIDNPKQLKIKELDAAQLTRSLPDVDAAVINTNYAILAGLYPKKDALFLEDKNSIYANIIVVREDETHDRRIQQFVAALHSDAVLKTAEKLFQDQAIPAWRTSSHHEHGRVL